jgi:hypothetical protein
MDKEPTITQTLLELDVVVEEILHQEKLEYFARCYMPGWADCALGVTPNEAAAEVLKKMAARMLAMPELVPTPHNENCTVERVDFKYETFKEDT